MIKYAPLPHSTQIGPKCVSGAEVRLKRLTDLISETVKSWTTAPVVEAYQALRGVSLIAAAVFVAEIGDIRRFENPRQLMALLGLVPSESSTGEHVKRGGSLSRELSGPSHADRRRMGLPLPCAGKSNQASAVGRSTPFARIAWKGQLRLCSRKMILAGKHKAIAITAIAREIGASVWAIGQEVQPAHHA